MFALVALEASHFVPSSPRSFLSFLHHTWDVEVARLFTHQHLRHVETRSLWSFCGIRANMVRLAVELFQLLAKHGMLFRLTGYCGCTALKVLCCSCFHVCRSVIIPNLYIMYKIFVYICTYIMYYIHRMFIGLLDSDMQTFHSAGNPLWRSKEIPCENALNTLKKQIDALREMYCSFFPKKCLGRRLSSQSMKP